MAAQPPTTRNPFSTRCVRPGALPFLFPSGMTAEDVLQRHRECGWRGEIVGPHGSGKSCLVQTLIPSLEAAGRRVLRYPVGAALDSDAPSRWRARSLTPDTHVLVDGYEQLSRFGRFRLRWGARRAGAGLLVTSHRGHGLPRLWTTVTSVELAERIVRQLLRASSCKAIRTEEIAAAYARHAGNLREVLMDLYDVYETRPAVQS